MRYAVTRRDAIGRPGFAHIESDLRVDAVTLNGLFTTSTVFDLTSPVV